MKLTNEKSSISFRSVIKWVTLDDLEQRYDHFVFSLKAVGFRANHIILAKAKAIPILPATKM